MCNCSLSHNHMSQSILTINLKMIYLRYSFLFDSTLSLTSNMCEKSTVLSLLVSSDINLFPFLPFTCNGSLNDSGYLGKLHDKAHCMKP